MVEIVLQIFAGAFFDLFVALLIKDEQSEV